MGWMETGEVREVRPLKDKGGNVFKTLLKLACPGVALEVAIPDSMPKPTAGQIIKAEGVFDAGYQGRLDLLLRKWEPIKT